MNSLEEIKAIEPIKPFRIVGLLPTIYKTVEEDGIVHAYDEDDDLIFSVRRKFYEKLLAENLET